MALCFLLAFSSSSPCTCGCACPSACGSACGYACGPGGSACGHACAFAPAYASAGAYACDSTRARSSACDTCGAHSRSSSHVCALVRSYRSFRRRPHSHAGCVGIRPLPTSLFQPLARSRCNGFLIISLCSHRAACPDWGGPRPVHHSDMDTSRVLPVAWLLLFARSSVALAFRG